MPVRPKERFLVFGSPALEQVEIDEVVACLKSGWLGTGPKTARFEKDFAAYTGGEHAIAVNSCTAALHLSLLASGVGPGDEVITTPLTFCASANAIIHAGARPVLADVDPATMNLDPAKVMEKVTPATKAILPVHFAGRMCDMDALCDLAEERELDLIEDCAHAIESTWKGRHAGTFGEFGCFSFYVTKNVVTGEGGMITARDPDKAARVKRLALHGLTADAWKRFSDEGYKHYLATEIGFKYNMMDIQASLGLHQLARVEANLVKREAVWAMYDKALADMPLGLPAPPEPDTRHARHLYTVMVDEEKTGVGRDDFLKAMTAENIGVGVHYLSLAEHPVYQEMYGWRPEDYPNAMRIGRRTVSLPMSAKLTPSDVADVVEAVRIALKA